MGGRCWAIGDVEDEMAPRNGLGRADGVSGVWIRAAVGPCPCRSLLSVKKWSEIVSRRRARPHASRCRDGQRGRSKTPSDEQASRSPARRAPGGPERGAGARGLPVWTFGVMSRQRRDSAAYNCKHAYM